jgi:hypothetical protein
MAEKLRVELENADWMRTMNSLQANAFSLKREKLFYLAADTLRIAADIAAATGNTEWEQDFRAASADCLKRGQEVNPDV